MAKKKSANFLPEYLKTDKNKKFLSSTLDQLIQTPELERLDGYVGTKLTPNYNPNTDFYLDNGTKLRKTYPFEPALVFKNSSGDVTDVVSFEDLLNELQVYKVDVSNIDSLLRSKYYAYDPYIDWDKLVNYYDYFWLPEGPNTIVINELGLNVDNEIIGSTNYSLPYFYTDSTGNQVAYELSNGMQVSFGDQVTPSTYREKLFFVEGVGESIKLIEIRLLEHYDGLSTSYNETFDSDKFDSFPFDGDRKLATEHEYITINRASKDLNSWSRYNRWFHKDVIKVSSIINNIAVNYDFNARAKRPIIEFKANIKLYNHGEIGLENVDVIDENTLDAFKTVNGSYGYYIDNVLLQSGHRVIFNADANNKNKIFSVGFTTGTTSTIVLTTVTVASTLSYAVSINFGNEYSGTTWYFDTVSNKWKFGQQRKTFNQSPLFDVHDKNLVSFANTSTYETNFQGTKVFGYDIGTGANDAILGFPLKYQNSSGIGSFLFKNYFMTDSFVIKENNLSSSKNVSICYLKNIESQQPFNVWQTITDYKLPIVEIQNTTSTTSTLSLTSLNVPINIGGIDSVNVIKNDIVLKSSFTATTTSSLITLEESLAENDLVAIKIITDQTPNDNGYYETPLSLSNNPLNGPVTDFTLSELKDHLNTMLDDINDIHYDGTNLRDITDYTKYGTRIVTNANPIAFTSLFIGKKEHNVVDALRTVGNHYHQFKQNFIRKLSNISVNANVYDAVDTILKEINVTKDFTSAYYRSDMLGHGDTRVIKSYTVTNPAITDYPIGFDFDLTSLSFKSLYIYINGTQCVYEKNYTINIDEITFISPLAVNDKIEIHSFNSTLGSFVPPTPTKLGLYPKYEPIIYTDDTFITSVQMIRGHDGSLLVAFGDYRDAIILEYEKRVYNNIKVLYQSNIFDVKAGFPGLFRNKSKFKQSIEILNQDFSYWAGINNVDTRTNLIYDAADTFTWNYKDSIDKVYNSEIPKHWRGFFNYFYDTDHPHTEPWVMLGFSKKPTWWDTYYSWTNVPKRTALINAITQGKISNPANTAQYDLNYARAGFSSIVPVDLSGNLVDPSTLVTENTLGVRSGPWNFGDGSPSETAWRNSSYWPYAVNIVSLLLNPADYLSALFDTSRLSYNVINQITYIQDDLYLSPKKIILDNENDAQSSGYSQLVIEVGKIRNKDYLTNLRNDLNYLNFNLFYKLGGFTNKEKLQINIDSIDPISNSPGLVLPYEDFNIILNVSNPVKVASASGIIIQKDNGKYIIKGYDLEKPYFDVLLPVKEFSSPALTVGGVTEDFTEWSGITQNKNFKLSNSETASANTSPTTRFYKQGQIVRYNNKFYRCKISHNPSSVFDITYWTAIPSLPSKGGVTVQTTKKFNNEITRYIYGTEINSIQEVYDIITGYGAYLESQGFEFDYYSTKFSQVMDWKYSAKEFLYWCTQGWANNNLITISPFAYSLKFSFLNSVVENLKDNRYEYSLLKADGKPFPQQNFSLTREDGYCTLQTVDTEEGFFFVKFISVQKEHGIIFNNSTVFNDTIFDTETGYKQRRIRLSGFRTKNWNGDLYSPGFVYDNFTIGDWGTYKTYEIGDIVRYNGSFYQASYKVESSDKFNFSKWSLLSEKPIPDLLPNFDYKIGQFEDFYSLDIDNFDYSQQKLAQHLIGYTPRTYFDNIFSNPISQYKFYQGYIKDKGTKNAIDKLSKASKFVNKGEITFNEEWAFRAGFYGAFSNYDEVEFPLLEGTSLENPYLVSFVESAPTDYSPLVNYVTPNDLLIKPLDFISTSVFPTISIENIEVPNSNYTKSASELSGTFNDAGIVLPTAGYVRLDDVTATAYNKNSLLDIARNNQIQNKSTIWTGFLENGQWSVYRYVKKTAKISGVYVSSPGENITFSCNLHHYLSIGDIVSVVNFNSQVNGVYIITAIPQVNQFTVQSTLTSIQNEEQFAYGNLFVFDVVRYSTLLEIVNKKQLLDLDQGELFWVDSGINNKWQVYEKTTEYPTDYINSIPEPAAQELGHTIWAGDGTDKFFVSAPNFNTSATYSYGRVKVYSRENDQPNRLFEYTLNSRDLTYANATKPTEFGYSMAYDYNKNYIIVGAPRASNIFSFTGLEEEPSDVVYGIDILISNSATVLSASGRAISNSGFLVSPDYVQWTMSLSATTSSISSSTGFFSTSPRIYEDEGVVKISSIGPYNDEEITEAVLTNPYPNSSTSSDRVRFGHSVYINEVTTTSNTLLLVGAPGTKNVGLGLYIYPNQVTFALSTSTTSTVSATIVSTVTNITTGTQGNVYAYRIRKAAGIQVGIPFTGISVYSTTTVSLKVGDQWGYKISGSATGGLLSISAPGYQDSTSSGVVQVFRYTNASITHYQTLFNPAGSTGEFGKDHIISYSGKYLIVSAPEYRNFDTSYGAVVIYILGSNNKYKFLQSLYNPVAISDLKFGHSLSLNKNETKLLVSGLGTNRSVTLAFDKNSQEKETTFDGGTTKFIEIVPDAGVVYAYQRFGSYFVLAHELIDNAVVQGSRYGYDVVSTNRYSYVGAPYSETTQGEDNSMAFIFDMPSIFSVKRQQPDLVDTNSAERIALIDKQKEEVSEYLEIIDPLKGKISGLAEQELKYKTPSDPAIYSIGRPATIVDDKNNWLDEHVGELWWDLSTVKFTWYEQGDDLFRKNNWGKVFPGSTIDIYEWVRSNVLPSVWAAQADTNEGISSGISGQPKYPNNEVISVKQVYNNVSGIFENVYYFWVKNKLVVPNVKNRRLSAYQVASYISDPQANGIRFAALLSPNSLAFANVQPLLIDDRISANVSFNKNNPIPRHTEWLLLTEGDPTSVPSALLEKKFIDSLLGQDIDGNLVPDADLTYRNRYGIGIRPQQTLFKNRIEALRNIISFVNYKLSKEEIVGLYSLDTLRLKDEIPNESFGKYDFLIDSLQELSQINTKAFEQAQLTCIVENGKIVQVNIVNPGKGYVFAPNVVILDNKTPATITTVINSLGEIVSTVIENSGYEFVTAPLLYVRSLTAILTSNVENNGRWTAHEYNKQSNQWIKIYAQRYNTEEFWDYIDWKSDNFNEFKTPLYVLENLSSITAYNNIPLGTYIRINNNGNGKSSIVERVEDGTLTSYFNSVYIESGTIKILDKTWNTDLSIYNYDASGLSDTLFDQTNVIELRNILYALKNDIFKDALKVNWNLMFFVGVRYALTEQKMLDWAFKTSFVNFVTDLGILDQRAVYKLENEKYFEDYVKEIKPYHSQLRNYTSKYNAIEYFSHNLTDFDMPPAYNQETLSFVPIHISSTSTATAFTLTNTLTNILPWKNWTENYTYYVKEIIVADGGQGYTQRPTVTLVSVNGDYGYGATAEAFIRAGKVVKILITNAGSGYLIAPIIQFTGGGNSVTQQATASVIIANDTVRKNLIGFRFDRISKDVEIEDVFVTDQFVCTGEQNSFILTWLANTDRSTISATLNGKLIYSTDYKLEYFKQDYEGYYAKSFTRITLLNTIPSANQVFKIVYKKNISLFNAVERIEQFYNPTTGMLENDVTNLVSGLDYPLTTYEGMIFQDTPPWGTTDFDTAPWDDLVQEYVTVKLKEDLYNTSTIIKVNTTTGITTGQSIVIGNTSTIRIRPETIVTGINSSTNEVTISSPTYRIKKVVSTATAIGSRITFTTTKLFRGDIKVGDKVLITNAVNNTFNSLYSVLTTTNSTFEVTATQVLSATTSQVTTSTEVRVLSILSTVSSTASVLDRVVKMSTGTASFSIQTYALYSQVATATVKFSSGSPTWYITTSSGTVVRAVINVTGASVGVMTTATATIYGYTEIDFWKYNYDPDLITVNLSGGTYYNGTNTSAFGSTATDVSVQGGGWIKPVGRYYGNKLKTTITGTTATVYADAIDGYYLRFLYRHADQAGLDYWVQTILDGGNTLLAVENYIKASSESTQISSTFNPDGLINPFRSYAPEEFVPGDTKDSLSLSVYTRPEKVNPIMFNGAIFTQPGIETTATINFITGEIPAGLLVTFDGRPLSRSSSYPLPGLNSSSYFLQGNKLTVAAQSLQGKIGYSYVTAGSSTGLDSQTAEVDFVTTSNTILISDLAYSDVSRAYVELDGVAINQYSTGTSLGYILEPVSSDNKRASVKIKNIPSGRHEVLAWFFRNNFESLNRIVEQYYSISTTTSLLTFASPPFMLEPISGQVIVEHLPGNNYGNRVRLLPPDISYYKVSNLQNTYDINNKRSGRIYNNQNVKVYVNGYEIRPGFDFTINQGSETVTINVGILRNNDTITVMDLVDFGYVVLDNQIRLKNALTSGSVKVTHFQNHDSMGIRTETFDLSHNNEYYLSLPIFNENYIWVTANDQSLIAGFDFYLKSDMQTVVIGNDVDMVLGSKIVINTINPINYSTNILAYRIWKDIFDRQSLQRITRFFRTRLAQPLNYFDTSIHVEDGSVLFSPNPSKNIPGVVFIDSERIEFFVKNGNELTQLRRGTYGTGTPWYSDAGTLVYDSSMRQNMSTEERSYIQHIPSSNTTTYIISTVSNTSSFSVNTTTSVGNGIVLLTTTTNGVLPAYEDQVEVYYGGRRLRKDSVTVHDISRAYDNTSSVFINGVYTASYEILPPEFSIQVGTSQTLRLNISEEVIPGVRITVVKKTSKIWDISTSSILTSTSTQAKFLRRGPAELPSVYYYGGNLELYDENNDPLAENDGDLLQGL